jgi:pyruvate/2-oxoglutarate dehydrogenase complex dihydrolipoamide dehydrogenase (E3) component
MVRAGNSLAEAARAVGLAGQTTISPEWAPVARRVREFTAGWDDSVAVERHEKKGETFVRGDARVVGPRAIEVDGHRFTARRGLVIATGGEPAAPPIEGLEDVDYWTNREAIEAPELPKSMIVLGAGAIGLELAQTFHRFGTEITIVERAEHALPMEEPENGEALGEVLRSEGIKLLTEATATRIIPTDGGISVELDDGSMLDGQRLLVATGRRVNLESLGIENIDLDPDARGIDTDPHLRAGDGAWAVGDVTGIAAFTHLAVYQGRIAAADILGLDHRPADYNAIPRVTFTDPEVASVGLSEAQAEQKGINVRTGIAPTSSSSRGAIHGPGAEHGFTKLVADADAGVLVGASTMGPAAGEVLGLLVLAVKEKVPISALRDLIYPYPTFVRGLEGALDELPH